MITNAKVLGVNRGSYFKDSKKIEYTDIYLDVTSICEEGRDGFGQFVSIYRVWKHAPNSIVGKTLSISVDRFLKVNDISL